MSSTARGSGASCSNLAQTKLFRARWSDLVHDEWIENLLANRPDLAREQLARTRSLMNAAVPDCLVEGFEALVGGIVLPDEDDRHVVAAAIMTRANVIVTFNEADFPREALEVFRLHTRHPDDFLMDLFSLAPREFTAAVIADFTHYRAPPLSFSDYLAALAKAGVPNLAKNLEGIAVLVPRSEG
nr:PIN domain-containing protein [Amaricoccus solimangrovi]